MRAVELVEIGYRESAKLKLQTNPTGQLVVPGASGGEGVGRMIGRMLKYAVPVPCGSQQMGVRVVVGGPFFQIRLSPSAEVCFMHAADPSLATALKSPGQLEIVNWMSAPLLRPPPSTTCRR